MSKLSENIKFFRNKKGLKQSELSKMLGKAPSVIANWEAETNRPDVESISKLCEVLDIDVNSLFGWTKPQAISAQAHHVGTLYDRASDDDQTIVNFTLKKYDIPVKSPKIPLYILPASAGNGSFLDGDACDLVAVSENVPENASFGVRISGNSMQPKYLNGNIAWVLFTPSVDVGQVGIFVVNGNGFIKQFQQDESGNSYLKSLNPNYENIYLCEEDTCRTVGLVLSTSEDIY